MPARVVPNIKKTCDLTAPIHSSNGPDERLVSPCRVLKLS
jgi:hypothetical protein